MFKQVYLLFIAVFLLIPFSHTDAKQVAKLSDQQVKQKIIEESISEYPGNCPCPYNRASNGSKCGKRSAWSRPRGYAPICYANEVNKEMISEWRKRN